MDRITANQQRLAFVKICVEIEAYMEIPRSIKVGMRDGSVVIVSVEVSWYPQKCLYCSIFGHVAKTCPKKPVVATPKVWVLKPVSKQANLRSS